MSADNDTRKKPRRPHGRAPDALRPLRLELGALKFAEGSAQIDVGDTRVLVAATVEPGVPRFRLDSGGGWLTAEYSMLPRSTHSRFPREVTRGRAGGRTLEIQRLIGRSLRSAVDLDALGERTVILDCDVLQADGGTRTAAVTAAYAALVEALAQAFFTRDLDRWPLRRQIAAVSAGYVEGAALLDLEYSEDSVAEVDLNVVGTAGGELVEVQGTGESRSFRRRELDVLLDLAFRGIGELVEAQNRALDGVLAEVAEVRRRAAGSRGRRGVPPRDEGELWGPPG
jgi:ribonuclease PH